MLILFCLGLGLLALFALHCFRQAHTVQHAANGSHGQLTRFAEEVLPARHLLVTQGTASNQFLVADGTARPMGTVPDTVDADNLDDEPKAIELLGIAPRTLPMVAAAAFDQDIDLYSLAGGKVGALPVAAGTYWRVGRSLNEAGGADVNVEVAHHAPVAVVVKA